MRQQSVAGIERLLAPRSVAVVGASPRPHSVGHLLLKSILDGGYDGELWAVHPTASEVLGVQAFPSIDELPATPDLAVVAVPAAAVLDVADQCGRRGVKGLLVVSAGFRETGEAGAGLEDRLAEKVRGHGMRMVGPNCVGLINTAARFDAVFAEHQVRPGHVGLLSQSGAVGLGLLHLADRHGLGVAHFVSLGNKPDVSGNDLLMAWADDERVRQVVFYLEGFGNPRNFVRIARGFSRKKPLLIVKSGRSAAGSRAAASHTGALADSDRTVDAMLRQCGALRFATVQAAFDAAIAFDHAPAPRGDRVAIVTNSGGPAIMAADALPAERLSLATLADETTTDLRRRLPAAASLDNPVDTIAGADGPTFCRIVDTLLADEGVDAVIAIHTSVLGDQDELVGPMARLRKEHPDKPLMAVLYGAPETGPHADLTAAGVPTYTFPEEAVQALGALRRFSRWRAAPEEEPVDRCPPLGLPDEDGWVTSAEALRILAEAGLPVARHVPVAGVEDAVAAADRIGYPVVLKADVEGVVHKSDAGLVHTGLHDEVALRAAWGRSVAGRDGLREAVVMEQARPGLEILLGAVQDPRYGPLVAFGLGGTQAEALADVHFRLAPLTPTDADHLMDDLRAKALLGEFRGQPARDLAALKEAMLRVGALAHAHPKIAELDINPMLLHSDGGVVVDARIRIGRGPDAAAPR